MRYKFFADLWTQITQRECQL